MINLFIILLLSFIVSVSSGNFYNFIPEKIATLQVNQHKLLETECWKELYLYVNQTKLFISYNKKKSFWCDDLLLYGNNYYIVIILYNGKNSKILFSS